MSIRDEDSEKNAIGGLDLLRLPDEELDAKLDEKADEGADQGAPLTGTSIPGKAATMARSDAASQRNKKSMITDMKSQAILDCNRLRDFKINRELISRT